MSRKLPSFAAALLAVSMFAAPASAGTVYGLMVGGVLPIMDGSGDRAKGFLSSPSVEGWVGYELPVPLVILSVEGRMGRISLRPKLSAEEFEQEYVYRASAGARVGMSFWILAPQIFAHMGYGWLSGNTADVVKSNRGLTYEGGFAVDIDALPFVRIGVYTSYNRLSHQREDDPGVDDTNWIAYGLQGTILW